MTAQETTDRLEARRADLIRTATELILGKGYRNTSVADIVGALGLSHGTFYNYFDSRRDILDAVIDHGGKLLTQRLVCLLYTSPSPRDGLLSRMPSSA